MRMPQCLGDGVGAMWDNDQMYMVGHQTIPDERTSVQSRFPSQQIEIDEAIGIGVENRTPRISTLRDVVHHTFSDDASEPRHKHIVDDGADYLGERSVCPRFPRFRAHRFRAHATRTNYA